MYMSDSTCSFCGSEKIQWKTQEVFVCTICGEYNDLNDDLIYEKYTHIRAKDKDDE